MDVGRVLWVIFPACLIIEITFVYLDLTVNWWKWSDSGAIRRLFNITREDGLASWFAVSQTLLVALVAWTIFAVVYCRRAFTWRRVGWTLVAVFFTYMCVDDGAAVHERMGTAFKGSTAVSSFPSYSWQFLLLPFFTLMGAFVLCFLLREMPRTVDRIKVVTAIGCFALAVGMDFVEGLDDGYGWLVQTMAWERDTIRHFSKSVEEFVEMVGMSIFLVAFISHLAATAPRLVIQFNTDGDSR
ncbi:MAG: hypothetical protein MAG794_01211 [Gammaproteobacteria bacterium]|nr:hypothetical protein [Gammaproteobacteria bacterium]